MIKEKIYFVLMGISNSGKTSTLKELIDKLLVNHAICEQKDVIGDDIRIKLKFNDKIIGITTRGDTEYALQKDFEWLGECDIYFFASHIKGKTRNYVYRISNGCQCVEHRKWSTSIYDAFVWKRINQLQSDELYTEIFELC